jgi:FkbM family methyltransferase
MNELVNAKQSHSASSNHPSKYIHTDTLNKGENRTVKELISWLFKKPVGGVFLNFDRCVLFILRISYLIQRVALLVFLGRKKRDGLYSKGRFSYFKDYFSPSFFLSCFFLRILKFLKLGDFKLLKMTVPKYDYKVYCPANRDDYLNVTVREEEILEQFSPKQGDVVVDVGAHIGRYALIGSKRVGPSGKVVAIEANPDNFNMLNRNVKLNQLTNMLTLNYAVFSEETKIKLYVTSDKLDPTIYNTILLNRAIYKEKFVEVDANTLDNLLRQNGVKAEDVNWVKIDVEGAELEVLKGATNVLSRSENIALLIEVHNVANGSNLYSSIMDLLGHYNFKIEFERTYPSGEKHVILRKQ